MKPKQPCVHCRRLFIANPRVNNQIKNIAAVTDVSEPAKAAGSNAKWIATSSKLFGPN